MEQLIEELTEKFKQAIPEGEDKLCEAFKGYLLFAKESLKKSDSKFISKDEASISSVLKSITERIMNTDLDNVKKELLIDENFDRLSALSGMANQLAEDVLRGKSVEVELDINEEIEEITKLLDLVEGYNKEQASWLASEGILDLKFIENPKTEVVSLRLNRTIQALKKQKEELDER